ncbi:peptide-methionine (S)-S-oxide reductase MsrA [Rhodocyclus tenuis]|uniref:Peptide methionine sulfoxide reductase MsrA n=2 Tax=Rhodocyclus TaxID=1064 RepID=A0A6L5K175_RHOTE|nr:peptide-methionine (S)-S-oxide reductase MsrA [Rhodocyclus gracilis]NJA88913.1 peptide-methionine (S)-S-oxide reductase MsrA [Rhodocyclus gracilis]
MGETKQQVGTEQKTGTELATFGGGCFWCLDAVFSELPGVISVVSGYAGGQSVAPTYEEVCSGRSGHAEVVQVTFDPGRVSFMDLLEVFFAIHDPTTLNRQGADVGTQYRSVIFYHSAAQREAAASLIDRFNLDDDLSKPLVTQLLPLAVFYPAEGYHQGYFAKHPEQGYCQAVISPKLRKFRQQFGNRFPRS